MKNIRFVVTHPERQTHPIDETIAYVSKKVEEILCKFTRVNPHGMLFTGSEHALDARVLTINHNKIENIAFMPRLANLSFEQLRAMSKIESGFGAQEWQLCVESVEGRHQHLFFEKGRFILRDVARAGDYQIRGTTTKNVASALS